MGKTENTTQKNQPLLQYVEQAYLYLEREKAKYSLENPRAQLAFSNEKIDKLQKKHVKFQQMHKGVPVWGKELIVHLDEGNSVYSVSGEILTGLSMLNTKPAIAPGGAGDVVMQAVQWGEQGWQTKDYELCIFSQNGNNYLAYRLTLVKGLLRVFVFVNANNGVIIHSISGTYTIK